MNITKKRYTDIEHKPVVTNGDRKVGRGKIGLGVKKSSGTEDVCEMKSYGNEDVCETCENCKALWHPTPVLLPGKSHGWGSL